MRKRVVVIPLAIGVFCLAGFGIWQGRINGMAEDFLSNGAKKAETKNLNGAIADFNQAIRLDPNNAIAYFLRGLIKQERSERQEALSDFRKTAELSQKQGNTERYNKSLDRIR